MQKSIKQKRTIFMSPYTLVDSPLETQDIARRIVLACAGRPRTHALCIALIGELGAGKTTFAQGIARALGITRPMPSPTFILMREVALTKECEGLRTLYHFDWYRLHRAQDVKKLGWQTIIKDPRNIVVVEWADRFPVLFPSHAFRIHLTHKDKGRAISIKGSNGIL